MHCSFLLCNETVFAQYEYVLVDCQLSSDGGAVKNSAGLYTSTTGGFLEVNVDQEIFYPYKETQGYEVSAPHIPALTCSQPHSHVLLAPSSHLLSAFPWLPPSSDSIQELAFCQL